MGVVLSSANAVSCAVAMKLSARPERQTARRCGAESSAMIPWALASPRSSSSSISAAARDGEPTGSASCLPVLGGSVWIASESGRYSTDDWAVVPYFVHEMVCKIHARERDACRQNPGQEIRKGAEEDVVADAGVRRRWIRECGADESPETNIRSRWYLSIIALDAIKDDGN